MKIILASASPRRKQLLSEIIDNFEIIPSDIKESFPSSLDLFQVSLFISDLKAKDIYSSHNDTLVIGSDTTIVLDNLILGKPKDKEDAKKMLTSLSNRMHYVVTGVTVYYQDKKYQINSINEVYFKNLSKSEIDKYLTHDEYKDKAGSYAIQGLAGKFIDHINGEYDSIVGFPSKEVRELLQNLNVSIK